MGSGEAVTSLGGPLRPAHHRPGPLVLRSAAAGLSALQMIVIAVVCIVAAAPGGIALPSDRRLGHGALHGAGGRGPRDLGQTWAQSHLPATRAAIVMTLEPVFAAGFAVAFGGEPLTPGCCGGALVLAAMYVVELVGRRRGATAAQDPPAECCTTRCEIRRTLTHRRHLAPWRLRATTLLRR